MRDRPRSGPSLLVLVGVCTVVVHCGGQDKGPGRAGATGQEPRTQSQLTARSASTAPRHYAKDYEFTEDWFTLRIPLWEQVLGPLRGRPGLQYLEIGLYEGRSALWVLENILTHPTARLTGIDVFTGEVKERYLANVRRSGHAEKVTTIVGPSQQEVRKLPPSTFDIVYVDGSHAADDVLADAVQSWVVLKPEGILIFDDYTWHGLRTPLAPELLPRLAIDAFVVSHRYSIEVLHRGSQMILQKRENPCAVSPLPGITKYFCSPFGQYLYAWDTRVLWRQSDGSRVDLTSDEVALIESFLRARTFELRDAADAFAQRRDFHALLERLGAPDLSRAQTSTR